MSEWVRDRGGALMQRVCHTRRLWAHRYADGSATINLSEEGQVPIIISLDKDAAEHIARALLGEAP